MSEIDLQRQVNALRRRLDSLETGETPAIACRVYKSTDFSHNSSGSWLAVEMPNERSDVYGMHEALTNPERVTVPLAGWYLITGHLNFAADATGKRGIAIYVDGTTNIASTLIDTSGSGATYMSIATLYYLAANNYVGLYAYQSSGGTLAVTAASNYSPELAVMRLA